MTATTTQPCTARVVREPKPVRDARRAIYLAAVLSLLEEGPRTTAEIARAIPKVPYRFIHRGGPDCAASSWEQCGGHLQPLRWGGGKSDDVQRLLVKLEREGLVARVVMDGRQAHLWSVVS